MIRRCACTALCMFALGALTARAQLFIGHKDLAVGGTGQFTPTFASQKITVHQATTTSVGFLASLREQPRTFAGFELNYQYSSFSERFTAQNGNLLVNTGLAFHEFTGAYLICKQKGRIKPFIALGGGYLYFSPEPQNYQTQLRPTALAAFGFQITSPTTRLGLRMQGRGLLYKDPNFNAPAVTTATSSIRWAATVQPAVSAFVRF